MIFLLIKELILFVYERVFSWANSFFVDAFLYECVFVCVFLREFFFAWTLSCMSACLRVFLNEFFYACFRACLRGRVGVFFLECFRFFFYKFPALAIKIRLFGNPQNPFFCWFPWFQGVKQIATKINNMATKTKRDCDHNKELRNRTSRFYIYGVWLADPIIMLLLKHWFHYLNKDAKLNHSDNRVSNNVPTSFTSILQVFD